MRVARRRQGCRAEIARKRQASSIASSSDNDQPFVWEKAKLRVDDSRQRAMNIAREEPEALPRKAAMTLNFVFVIQGECARICMAVDCCVLYCGATWRRRRSRGILLFPFLATSSRVRAAGLHRELACRTGTVRHR